MKIRIVATVMLCWLGLTVSSCITYYERNRRFQTAFEQGQIAQADKILASDKKAVKRKRNRILYYFHRGTTQAMMGKFDSSNAFFEHAYRIADSYHTNYANEALALVSNPSVTEYRPENHETLMLHYYKALNFLQLGNREAALVECKRLNIKLNQLSDKYKSDKKFKRDAFIHLLMGLIYEANSDYNNAFIAYRNAYEIYRDDYARLFGMAAPEQLKRDLIRAAYLTGFKKEGKDYEKQFGMKYTPSPKNSGELIFLWNNGLSPVKDEWSINFNIVRGQGGEVFFINEQLGVRFPFMLDEQEKDKQKGLAALEFIRIAFPKYVERPPANVSATLSANGQTFPLQLTENVNAISFRCLEDRLIFEAGKSLLRLALKKVSEYQLRKKDENLGAVLGAFNAITEKADTRNWQTMPHSIYYSRVSLPQGKQSVTLNTQKRNGSTGNQPLTFDVQANEMQFFVYQSL